MLFSGIPFLYWFLPLFLLCLLATPRRYRNVTVLAFSLLFYAWGEPKYVFLMMATILAGYGEGRLLETYRGRPGCKALLAAAVAVDLGSLLYFKYTDFFIANFNAATGLSLPLLRVALPIGISFYTFQLLSYVIDVYRGVPAQRSLLKLATYIALFPQLIAGPIVRYTDVASALDERRAGVSDMACGARRFVLGLAKKVLLANILGELCDVFRASGEKSVLFFWLYAAALCLHIYFDFSGYSDMAIGLGRICGFHFPENFDYPFISGSITEFWRRWHKSLGTWFRDYVYIPLGGSRTTKLKQLRNILIVWALTGFWHGAAWTFIVWGLLFAALLTVEKLGLLTVLMRWRVLNHAYVLFWILISFVIFNAADMTQAFSDIGGLFGGGGVALTSPEAVYYIKSYAVVLLLGIIGATPLPKRLFAHLDGTPAGRRVLTVLEPLALAALLVVCTAYLADGSFNPFLYFRF